MTSPQEAQSVLRAQVGDREAIEALMRSVLPMLTCYVRATVGAVDAEDVTQDVMVLIRQASLSMGWTFRIMAAISQAAWIALVLGARTASEKQLILLAALAVACTVFGGVFLLVLLIFRMTHKLLLAIELSGRRA